MQNQTLQDFSKTLIKYTVFSYLPGCCLFHKIALVNKEVRRNLAKFKLLDQKKVITRREYPVGEDLLPELNSFLYALSIADGI